MFDVYDDPAGVNAVVRAIVMSERRRIVGVAPAAALRMIAEATARGALSGAGAWRSWGVGSWMRERMFSYIPSAESATGLCFLQLVIEYQQQTGCQWDDILDRPWVPIDPKTLPESCPQPADMIDAERRLREERERVSFQKSPRPKFAEDLSLVDRWHAYVEAVETERPTRFDWYFPPRTTAEETSLLVSLFLQLKNGTQDRIIEDASSSKQASAKALRRAAVQLRTSVR